MAEGDGVGMVRTREMGALGGASGGGGRIGTRSSGNAGAQDAGRGARAGGSLAVRTDEGSGSSSDTTTSTSNENESRLPVTLSRMTQNERGLQSAKGAGSPKKKVR
jgi:hypothetical protein